MPTREKLKFPSTSQIHYLPEITRINCIVPQFPLLSTLPPPAMLRDTRNIRCIMNTTLTSRLLVNMITSQHQHHCIARLNTPLNLVEQTALGYLNKLLKSNVHTTQVHQTSHYLNECCNHHLNQAERAIKTSRAVLTRHTTVAQIFRTPITF